MTRVSFGLFAAGLLVLTAVSSWAGEIHDAAASGDLSKLRALLAADPALLEARDSTGCTPLIRACLGAQVEAGTYLIGKGANIHAANNEGATPLYFAAAKSFELAERLVALKADVNVRAYVNRSYTPLHEAATSGDLRVARLLIEHGADLNFRGSVGTALQRTIYNKKESATAMAKLLLESGAKLQDFSFGNTELHIAALRNYPEIVPILVKHGAGVNAVNRYGRTPLYYAARHGHRRVAEALIAAGADKRTVVETNYGTAPQLDETLKEGEAYLWYIGDTMPPATGYAVRTKDHLLLFNPPAIGESPEAGLANGYLNPKELAGQKITVLMTHPVAVKRPSVAELAKRLPGATIVLSSEPSGGGAGNAGNPAYRVATPHESFSIGGIRVHAIPAGRQAEALGYLIEADGLKIFHAGLHSAAWNTASEVERYRKEIDYLKPFGPIDIAILPIRGRHIEIAYEPYLYLLDQLSPRAVYLIGDDLTTEEHRKCIEVLRARNVPVFYPEGGLAVGERFHYVRGSVRDPE